MIFKDDVIFLIEEYEARFGSLPVGLTGCSFPRRSDWQAIVSAIRVALDSGQPINAPLELEAAA
ncbi:MAG: hypothetical protein AAFQ42_12375 [Pseudomonadota bacterium]